MSHLFTPDVYDRVEAWTERVALASSQQKLEDSTESGTAPSKARTRAPLLPTSSNIKKRKRHLPDGPDQKASPTLAQEIDVHVPARASTKRQKRGPTNKPDQKAPARPRVTSNRKSSAPAKQGKGIMAEERAKQPADLNHRRFPARERKPSARAREGLVAEQPSTQEVAYRPSIPTKGGQSAQSRPRLGHPAHPLSPPATTPNAHPHGNPTQLTAAQILHPFHREVDENGRPHPSPSKGLGSPSRASRSSGNTPSPTRSKRERTMTKPKNDKSLNMDDLASCTPSIGIKSIQAVLASSQFKGKLPDAVDSLRKKLQRRSGFVPQVLKSQYVQEFNTPNKTRGDVPVNGFQDTFAAKLEHANMLKQVVDYVMDTASFNFNANAHERQWSSTTVSGLINPLVMGLHQRARFVNIESCSISPSELCPVRRNGGPISDAEVESNPTSLATDDSNTDSTTSRMIDLAVGLALSADEQGVIDDSFQCLPDGQKSLNQQLAYPVNVPFFLDIELKKTHAQRQPEVQLGVWQAAGFNKRYYNGWSEELMPMPGICINGHDWSYYITFPTRADLNFKLVMMGPFAMGHTRDIFGTWEIMYKLDVILQWGITEYKQWFDRVVIGQAKAAIA